MKCKLFGSDKKDEDEAIGLEGAFVGKEVGGFVSPGLVGLVVMGASVGRLVGCLDG